MSIIWGGAREIANEQTEGCLARHPSDPRSRQSPPADRPGATPDVILTFACCEHET